VPLARPGLVGGGFLSLTAIKTNPIKNADVAIFKSDNKNADVAIFKSGKLSF
jgi:hypothetical protein